MNTPEYYTMDELRAFGCPNELLMQYIFFTKAEIDKLLAFRDRGVE